MATNQPNTPSVAIKSNNPIIVAPGEITTPGFKVFGYEMNKKYIYIIGGILLLAVAYYVYKKWYAKKPLTEAEESDNDNDSEVENYNNSKPNIDIPEPSSQLEPLSTDS